VKNHEQPKGTIGSLEKALERYGVPVKEVEDFEREHGKGTAGTMADPKNLKMKLKTKIQDFSRRGTPGPYGVDPDARPAGYRPSPTATDDSPTMSDGVKKSPETAATNGHFTTNASTADAGRQSAPQAASTSPANSFTAVRPTWVGVTTPQTMPVKAEPEPKRLQGDFGTSTAGINEPPQAQQTGVLNGATLFPPPPIATTSPPRSEPPVKATVGSTPFAAINQHPAVPVSTPDSVASVAQAQTNHAAVEDKKPNGEPTFGQEPVGPKAKDGDVEMTGMSERSEEKGEQNGVETGEKNGVNGESRLEVKSEPEKVVQPGENAEPRSETMEVDRNTNKDASGPTTRRSTMQSPLITTRSLAATTPGSARRPSRRSSAARKSVDVDGESGKAAPTSEDGDKDVKDGKDEKAEKPETRRSLTGRVLRRGTKY
jgi:hypothetical protein